MYNNLEAEIKRKSLSRAKLAERMGCNPSTISFKLTGKTPFTLPEAKRMKEILQVEISLDDLFATDENPQKGRVKQKPPGQHSGKENYEKV